MYIDLTVAVSTGNIAVKLDPDIKSVLEQKLMLKKLEIILLF